MKHKSYLILFIVLMLSVSVISMSACSSKPDTEDDDTKEEDTPEGIGDIDLNDSLIEPLEPAAEDTEP
ncbi:hypothetical protein ACFL96_20350, partial [Thermoproteota archaeon]